MKQTIKKEAIIQAAEKRFRHFTVTKTTMAEIARDLGISKALLYYYFPDKLSLYAAVISHIFSELKNLQHSDILEYEDPLENIRFYLQRRKDFIVKHYNIIEFVEQAIEKAPGELKPLFENAKTIEINIIQTIFEKGVADKILYINDLSATTELFLLSLEGLRHICLHEDGVTVFPSKQQFDAIFIKEQELASIFVKGLQIP